jgi:hypothetical protein
VAISWCARNLCGVAVLKREKTEFCGSVYCYTPLAWLHRIQLDAGTKPTWMVFGDLCKIQVPSMIYKVSWST